MTMIKKMLIALTRRNKKQYKNQVHDSPSPPPSYMKLKAGGGGEPCSIVQRGRPTCKSTAASCRKGYVPVMVVGDTGYVERFLIPTELIAHPSILTLLDQAAGEFGFEREGAIQIPCDPDNFRDIVSHLKTRY